MTQQRWHLTDGVIIGDEAAVPRHHDDLSSVEALLGTQLTWCPACGIPPTHTVASGGHNSVEAK